MVRFNSTHYIIDDFFIDFVVPDKEIAIEINGPQHYIIPTKELTMTSEAKNRVLRKKGWKVIVVPFFANKTKDDPKLETILDFDRILKQWH